MFVSHVRTLGADMKCASIVPLAIVFAASSAFGQATYQKPVQLDPNNCPVGLRVRHGGGLPISVGAADLKSQNGKVPLSVQNQGIHLAVANASSRDIVGLEITVHGLSETWRYVPLSDMPQKPDFAKSVGLSLDVKKSGHASRDLSLNHFTAVTSVDLNSIKYADGSEWDAPSATACSVTPDLIMFVATR
jgi:hypothetical protein